MRTKVIVTVDTETSMGGAWQYPERRPLPVDRRIFCRRGGRSWGVPMIADILGRYGMKATFFCEMLATEVIGKGESERFVHYLMEHGQDVQLHAHPTFWFYARHLEALGNGGASRQLPPMTDQCSALSPELARELLGSGCDQLAGFAGKRPVAFRAGGYSADAGTLRVLGELGIEIDSSYNPVYRWNNSFPNSPLPENAVRRIEGVWEVPITVFRMSYPQNGGMMPLEISAVSLREMKAALEHAHETEQEVVVAVFHSFSTVKPKDVFYSDFRPDRVVLWRLEKLARYLAEHSDRFQVTTMGEMAKAGMRESGPPAGLAHVGWVAPVLRKAVQAVNRIYWT